MDVKINGWLKLINYQAILLEKLSNINNISNVQLIIDLWSAVKWLNINILIKIRNEITLHYSFFEFIDAKDIVFEV